MVAHVGDGLARWASPFVRNVRQTIIIYSDVFHARFQATALIRAGLSLYIFCMLLYISACVPLKESILKKCI